MFEHEENYTGYFIVYDDKFYYVYEDDENYLYVYSFIIGRDEHNGVQKNKMSYIFDFENPHVISKKDSNYVIRSYNIGISHDKIMSYKKEYEDSIRKFGDILTVKKHNHKLIYLWEDENYIYYIGMRGNHILNRIEKILPDKINKLYSRLTNDEKIELITKIDEEILTSNINFTDENINEINKIKKIYSKGGE